MLKEMDENLLLIRSKFLNQREYWNKKLSGEIAKTEGVSALKQISADSRPRVRFSICFPNELAHRLIKIGKGSELSMYIILVAGIKSLIYRYTGENDIIVISPLDEIKISHETINHCVMIRDQVFGFNSFKEIILQVRESVLGAYQNQDYPVEKLIEFIFDDPQVKQLKDISDIACSFKGIHANQNIAELKVGISLVFSMKGEGIEVQLIHNFDDTVGNDFHFIDHLISLLQHALEDVNIKISQLLYLSEKERKQLVFEFNNNQKDFNNQLTVTKYFEKQAQFRPNSIALEFENMFFTYRYTSLVSDHWSSKIRDLGINTDQTVGIMLNRSPLMMVMILAIWKAGGAYIPLGVQYPFSRVLTILKDSAATILCLESGINDTQFEKNFSGCVINCDIHQMLNLKQFERVTTYYGDIDNKRLAYVIYTSGSTGTPKGVMVEHIGMMNHIHAKINDLQLDRECIIAQNASHTFDISIWQFFTAFVLGGICVIYPDEIILDPRHFISRFQKDRVTILEVVPSYLAVMLEVLESENSVYFYELPIQFLLVTGEEIKLPLVKRWLDKFPHIKMVNAYGPTEVSDDITHFIVDKIPGEEPIPIGSPIQNLNIYITDPYMNLCPVGIKGEICVAGVGVGRGYLNDPEKTAKVFIKDTIIELDNRDPKWVRLFKTGDIGRWLPGGIIEFFGRKDYQIKIRGFRIELGEIEKHLLHHPKIKEVVVIHRQNQQEQSDLYAFVVMDGKLDVQELKIHLGKKIPGYMIPAYFIQLPKMPLTSNGKINRNALPEFDENSITAIQIPQSEIELLLTEILENVLNRKSIGINENFFLLGGDSIKAIQIASRIYKAGYKVEMRDIFQNPTIKDLALKVKKLENIAQQKSITGQVSLTPIQHRFFENRSSERHHFNQAVLLRTNERFVPKVIQTMLSKIQEHHDALRLTFKEEEGKITARIQDEKLPLALQVIDLGRAKNEKDELENYANQIQRSISLENGPLMQSAIFQLHDGDRLLIVIHHLVIDGISWRILFEDIETLWQQIQRGETLELPLKTESYKLWSEQLQEYANNPSFLKEKEYWKSFQSFNISRIEKDFPRTINKVKDIRSLSFHLSKGDTQKLLTKVNHAFATEINDILVTGLGLAVEKIFGKDKVLLGMEGHGRESIDDPLDISRTVGWFTAIYPLVLDLSHRNNLALQIKTVKENLHQVPQKGIGYGILKYLTSDENKRDIHFSLMPQICFNYLGQFDTDVKQMSFQMANESIGYSQSPERLREYELDVSGMIANGQLVMSIAYSKEQYQSDTINKLIDQYQLELQQIIAFCSTREERELTPCDMTYKSLSLDFLEQIQKKYPLEDIYRLSPMQEGMLFHALMETDSATYFEQISYQLHGELDIQLFEKSVNELFKRYEILRTVFIHENVSRPLQMVLKERQIRITFKDFRHIETHDKDKYINLYKEKDKNLRFDLEQDILMRVAVIQIEESIFEVIWSFHHILMDGWCIGIIISDFSVIYKSLLEGREANLEPVKPYRLYIQWLEEQDREEPKKYWGNYLRGYDQVAILPKIKTFNSLSEGYRKKRVILELNEGKSNKIQEISGKYNVTINTIIQTLWGILLGIYNNRQDVVFGAVVSGRPFEIADVEKMVGLFINTIPVRIQFENNDSFCRLMQEVQNRAVESESRHYYPLVEIQSHSLLKQNLIDHILIFENFPIMARIKESYPEKAGKNNTLLTVSNSEAFEQTNYDLNLVIVHHLQLIIRFEFNELVYEEREVKRITKYFKRLINKFIKNVDTPIGGITLIDGQEKRELIDQLNRTDKDFPINRCLIHLFEEQIVKNPGNIALENENHALQYNELNRLAEKIAAKLQQAGVKPGMIVGLLCQRSFEAIIGILGILKAGGAYLAIDPEYPLERKNYMIRNSQINILIIEKFLENAERELVSKNPGLHHMMIAFQQLKDEKIFMGLREVKASSEQLAYVIYTSGTSGYPKGVLISNRSVVNYVSWGANIYLPVESCSFPLFTSLSFDLTVTSIFIPLVSGNKITVYGDDEEQFVLEKVFKENRVDIVKLTPSHLKIILQLKIYSPRIRTLIIGGEELTTGIAREVHDAFSGNITIYNEYGPTEATVGCMIHQFDVERNNGVSVPIGLPIDNTRIYILDSNKKPLPPGITGEIYIGGQGIAKGYLKKPQLNKEKFIENPFEKGEKIYKSGDMGRWNWDNLLEFYGRNDQQVKIKGYRIELTEIEQTILQYSRIKDAIVLVKEDMGGNDTLCAYIVPLYNERDKQFSNLSNELRTHLVEKLPHYMIPAFFIPIEKIPLNTHGKVDLKGLPQPGKLRVEKNNISARNKTEEILIQVWQQVLGIKNIGISDHFFQLGGESIKAILISAGLKKFGLSLNLRDLFLYPVIKDLSPHIKKMSRQISQDTVEGIVPLTPIQHWFFESQFKNPHHFNQSMMLFRPEGFDEIILEEVFREILKQHDTLRMIYQLENENDSFNQHSQQTPHFIQYNRGIKGKTFDMEIIGINDEIQDEKSDQLIPNKIENEANRIQRSIHLNNGPLVKLGLFKTNEGDHLLIVIHHLLVDGISWRILFEDIANGYRQRIKNQEIKLQEKSDSFKYWAEKLNQYAYDMTTIGSPKVIKELAYWQSIDKEIEKMSPIPRDHLIRENEKINKNIETVAIHLSRNETKDLLKRVNQTFNTEINHILLTALTQAFRQRFGIDKLLVELEGHGREPIFEDMDLSRTIGWFTTQFPVILESFDPEDLALNIKLIKETIRKIPNKGIGYGVLKYLNPNAKRTKTQDIDQEKFHIKPEVGFNYLGEFSQLSDVSSIPEDKQGTVNDSSSHDGIETSNLFQLSTLGTGLSRSPEAKHIYTININGLVLEEQLTFYFAFNGLEYQRKSIEKLSEGFKDILLKIIELCKYYSRIEFTPSDFGNTSLSIEEFDRITGHITQQIGKNVEIQFIYPLSPMQQGMLFHWLKNENSTAYFEQGTYEIQGIIEHQLLEKSINILIHHHDILRTIFINEGLSEPLQIVLKNRTMKVFFEDISFMEPIEQHKYLENFKQSERKTGFEISRDFLMQLSLFKTGIQSSQLVWSFFHIIMDGWCMPIIFNQLIYTYNCLKDNKTPTIQDHTPYINYIRWLENQDMRKSLHYWQSYLDGYDEPAGLNIDDVRESSRDNSYLLQYHDMNIDEGTIIGLNQITANIHVTINTIIQAFWGILLQRYNNRSDIVFGVVVSGRPSAIKGIENMIGLFINTMPLRITTNEEQLVSQLLEELQAHAITSKMHEFVSLADIQAISDLKRNLFHHIMIFESNPAYEINEKNDFEHPTPIQIKNFQMREQTNYPLNIIINTGPKENPREHHQGVTIRFNYNGSIYEQDFIKQVGLHLEAIFQQVIDQPNIKIKDIDLLLEEEKQKILFRFNQTHVNFPKNITVIEMFENHMKKPEVQERVAVTYRDLQLSYHHLNLNCNQLAHYLRSRGVKTGILVGIMLKRSIKMLISVLGILKANGAYLPIEPELPLFRVEFMLKDSNARFLITQKKLFNPRTLNIEIIDFGANEIYTQKRNLPKQFCHPHHLIYVIYTSGTTGKPKGVLINHSSVVNLLFSLQQTYPLKKNDVYLFKTSFIFDVSVTEILGWFIASGKLAILDPGGEKDPYLILDKIFNWSITHINFVTSMFAVFLEIIKNNNFSKIRSLKYIFLAGEALSGQLVQTFNQLGTKICIENIYGPTENTVYASRYSLNAWKGKGRVPIGQGMPNIQIYILSQGNHMQPIGVQGELFIGGKGVARGYMNNPELTVDRFYGYHGPGGLPKKPPPLSAPTAMGPHKNFLYKQEFWEVRREKHYKTGDLGRWLANGNIEFLGRMDQQIKIRGFRIEPSEIEVQLKVIEPVSDALVMMKKDSKKEGYLVAFLIFKTGMTITEQELKKYLAEKLPTYMVPSFFVFLDKFPFTSSGKIDRKKLQKSVIKNGGIGKYEPPANETEKKLLEIWAQVLDRKKHTIGLEDNFFQIGGHSIKAIQIISKIQKIFGIHISIEHVFDKPLIRLFARYLDSQKNKGISKIKSLEKREYYELSFAQKRLWMAVQLEKDGTAYNIHGHYLFNELNKSKFQYVLENIIKRHEILRTAFTKINGEPKQRIYQYEQLNHWIEHVDLENLAPENVKQRIEQLTNSSEKVIFLLTKPPLLKITLIHLKSNRYLFLYTLHHIIADAWSMDVLVKEVIDGYQSDQNLKQLSKGIFRVQYKDFVAWQNSQLTGSNLEKLRTYWRKQISENPPVLDLKTDFPRPAEKTFNGNQVYFKLDETMTMSLNQLSHQEGVSLFMKLMTSLYLLLYYYTGQTDIIIGFPITGRDHHDLENQIGFYSNILALRIDFSNKDSFNSLLGKIKKFMMEGYEHQLYPFDTLLKDLNIKRYANRSPLCDVMAQLLVKDASDQEIIPGDAEFKTKEVRIKYDIQVSFIDGKKFIEVIFEYNRDLFKEETILRMIKRMKTLLGKAIKEPGLCLADLCLDDVPESQVIQPIIRRRSIKNKDG